MIIVIVIYDYNTTTTVNFYCLQPIMSLDQFNQDEVNIRYAKLFSYKICKKRLLK